MPYIGSTFFSRRRNSIDSWLGHHPEPQVSQVGQVTQVIQATQETGFKLHRNKLRKQPPFRYSEPNVVAEDLSALMGNNVSLLDKISRPSRPPRPCASDLPDLPSLPIYEALGSQHPPATVLDDDIKPPIPLKSSSRRSSFCERSSVCESPLTAINSPRGRPVERDDSKQGSLSRRYYSSSVDGAAVSPRTAPPRYDRASHLAESYRAVLPDISSLDTGTIRAQQPRLEPEHPRSQNFYKWPWETRRQPYYNDPHPDTRQKPAGTIGPGMAIARPPSTASSSSVTVAEHGNHSGDEYLAFSTRSTSSYQHVELFKAREAWHPKELQIHQRPRRPCSSDDVGLQICTELLRDQLSKTFFGEGGGGSGARDSGSDAGAGTGFSKLQILLLIEAYEATLELCRKEVLHPPLAGATEAESLRKRHAREAVRILDHWLNSLYCIYDENFAGDELEPKQREGAVHWQ